MAGALVVLPAREDGSEILGEGAATGRKLQSIPFSVVADILGWSAPIMALMVTRYRHIGDAVRRKAVGVLNRPIEVALRGQSWHPSEKASLALSA